MARPTTGPSLIDGLEGSANAKRRARLVLETLAGLVSVDEAARQLEITPQRFHVLRDELLSRMVAEAEPKPAGRPPSVPSEDERLAAARAEGAAEERRRIHGDMAFAARAAELKEELRALGIARPRRAKRGR
jgi:hypothetical protein